MVSTLPGWMEAKSAWTTSTGTGGAEGTVRECCHGGQRSVPGYGAGMEVPGRGKEGKALDAVRTGEGCGKGDETAHAVTEQWHCGAGDGRGGLERRKEAVGDVGVEVEAGFHVAGFTPVEQKRPCTVLAQP